MESKENNADQPAKRIWNPWDTFLGDCSVVDQYLLDKPVLSFKWSPLHFLNVLLRAVGQPMFVNNPLCGLVILAGLFTAGPNIGCGTLLGGSVATLTEMVFRLQPWELMRNGVAPFNAILVGSVFSALFPEFIGPPDYRLYVAIVICSFISVFLCSAMENTLGKWKVPYLALPLCSLGVMSFMAFPVIDGGLLHEDLSATNKTNASIWAEFPAGLDWDRFGEGVVKSVGQVYGINNIYGSMVIGIGVFLASPLNFLTSVLGGFLGCLVGVVFSVGQEDAKVLDEVYNGIWGYNAVIGLASVSCVFFAIGGMSVLMALINVGLIGMMQLGFRHALYVQYHVPFFTLPFTLCTFMFLSVTDKRGWLYRVEDMSYPEKQTLLWRRNTKVLQADTKEEEA